MFGLESFSEQRGIARVPSPVADLERRRFLFVTGKGGVGKTTASAAMARAFASRGRRVLVAMAHTKERLSALLGCPPIGDDVIEVAPSISAVNISPEKALAEYGEMVIKVRALSHAVFENKSIKSFFRAVPGLYEWSMLGKAWFHTTETDASGKNRFDTVIFDAPATGHGLDMLRIPKIILEVAPPGALRRDAERAWKLFTDPEKSGVIVVTLPEELPTTETLELIEAVRTDTKLPLCHVFENAVRPNVFTEAERSLLREQRDLLGLRAPLDARSGMSAVVAGARRGVREFVQDECVKRLVASTTLPITILPYLADDASTKSGTDKLRDYLLGKEVFGAEGSAG